MVRELTWVRSQGGDLIRPESVGNQRGGVCCDASICQNRTSAETFGKRWAGLAFKLNPVLFVSLCVGVADQVLQRPVVGEQQESFGILIESARGVNVW